MTATNTPLAGWLAKLTTLSFGRTQWQHCYFVLLDSELRFYKDEHADLASHVLNLKNVKRIIQLELSNRSFCIRLEPYSTAEKNPWTLACSSQADLEAWIYALQKRLVRSSANISSPGFSPVGNLKKKRPTNSWFSQQPSSFFHFDDTDDDNISFFDDSINNEYNKTQQKKSDSYYHTITPSTVVRPRIRKNSKNQSPPSFSRRRGIYLEPLLIASSPFNHVSKNKDDSNHYVHALSSFDSTPTSCSDVSLSSPSLLSLATTAVDTRASADNIKTVRTSLPLSSSMTDSCENLDRGRSKSAPNIFQNNNKHGLADGETSPTFLLYKERFRLC
ncbi:hypothetical protein INT45_010782 [Circinella minor]|uniref:PH domain-containing protein n=1 Tax=Circinella minor TaxID=1195481 RepID=A0A8H7RWX0_9FUNG|nr:hypothetical protein INT45_010782 [Circinella minor]